MRDQRTGRDGGAEVVGQRTGAAVVDDDVARGGGGGENPQLGLVGVKRVTGDLFAAF
ncbi:MAG: hypothetical protein WA376_20045 [Terrimicrobiaceae bacterium]